MGLLKWIGRLLGLFVLAVVFLGAYLYFTDAAVEATVTEAGSNYAVVTPKLLPSYHYRVDLDSTTASVVCKGYQVEFRIQSKDLIVRDAGGDIVYSEKEGRKTTYPNALKCRATNPTGGGILGL